MSYPLSSDDSAADMDERRFENVAVKRIVEIEALWRISAESENVLLREPEAPTQPWILAA